MEKLWIKWIIGVFFYILGMSILYLNTDFYIWFAIGLCFFGAVFMLESDYTRIINTTRDRR